MVLVASATPVSIISPAVCLAIASMDISAKNSLALKGLMPICFVTCGSIVSILSEACGLRIKKSTNLS